MFLLIGGNVLIVDCLLPSFIGVKFHELMRVKCASAMQTVSLCTLPGSHHMHTAAPHAKVECT